MYQYKDNVFKVQIYVKIKNDFEAKKKTAVAFSKQTKVIVNFS